MNLKRLKKELNLITEDKNLEAVTEEVVGKGEDSVSFKQHLVIFDKITKRIIIKFNLNDSQVYRTNGTGFYKGG